MLTEAEHFVLADIEKWVKEKFAQGPSSHSWDHTKRVLDNAVIICRAEGGDEFLVRLATLFHDLGRISEARGGLYRGRPIETYGGHSMLSLWESHKKIQALRAAGALNREQCKELTYIIYWHSKLLTGSPRETKNLMIVKDADMIDSFGFEGILRNFSQSKETGLPLWAPGLTIDFPEDRPLSIPEADASGLGNQQFAYNFRHLLVFESSRELAEPLLALNRDLLQLLRQKIHCGEIRDYKFWMQFVNWTKNRGLNRLMNKLLEEFESTLSG